ncbi:MAG TPA: hypothetical protein VIL97_04570 [Thermoanaerobaculia bacterium]
MKKIALVTALLMLIALPSFAVYVVVMRDGTRYKATEKWTVTGGKAIIKLENGSVIQVDPKEIDVAKTDETNRLGLGDARLINTAQSQTPTTSNARKESAFGGVKLRDLPPSPSAKQTTAPGPAAPQPNKPADDGTVPANIVSKFEKAYENVGLFGARLTSNGSRILHVELAADNEDQVFKAISATSFVLANLAQISNGSSIDMVELYMATMRAGAAGRFHMTPEDAATITNKQMTWQQYYVTKVLF